MFGCQLDDGLREVVTALVEGEEAGDTDRERICACSRLRCGVRYAEEGADARGVNLTEAGEAAPWLQGDVVFRRHAGGASGTVAATVAGAKAGASADRAPKGPEALA